MMTAEEKRERASKVVGEVLQSNDLEAAIAHYERLTMLSSSCSAASYRQGSLAGAT